MELTTSWQEEGIQQGLQQGLQPERVNTLIALFSRRFGTLPTDFVQRLQQLPLSRLPDIVTALDFADLADAQRWFAADETALN